MEKKLATKYDRSYTKEDLKTQDRQKKIKTMSNLGLLASLGATGYGSFKKNKALGAAGIIGAGASGYFKGMAGHRSDMAEKRIKDRYLDKEAMFRRAAYSATKKQSGKTMSGLDKFMSLFSDVTISPELGKSFHKAIQKIEKVSPRYADLVMEAIPGGAGQKKLLDQISHDAERLKKATDILKNTRTGNAFKYFKGKSKGSGLKSYIEEPHKSVDDAKKFRDMEDNLASAAKYTLAAAGIAGITGMAGKLKASKETPFWEGFSKKSAAGELQNIPAPEPLKNVKPALAPMPSLGDVNQGSATQLVAGK